jgi:Phage P2 GpU
MSALGSWGFYIFMASSEDGTTNTFDKLTDTNTSRYAEHKIIQGVPLLEFAGEELIVVTLQIGFLKPYTADPVEMLTILKLQKGLHTPLPLIVGDALVGRDLITLFVLTELKTSWQRFNGPVCVEASVAATFKEASSIGIGTILAAVGV